MRLVDAIQGIRRWTDRYGAGGDDFNGFPHVTITLSSPEKYRRAITNLMSNEYSVLGGFEPMKTIGPLHTRFKMHGVDVSIAAAWAEMTPGLSKSQDRINELERENADLRRRLDQALLEVEAYHTYRSTE